MSFIPVLDDPRSIVVSAHDQDFGMFSGCGRFERGGKLFAIRERKTGYRGPRAAQESS